MKKLRVLVVDDEPMIAQELAKKLDHCRELEVIGKTESISETLDFLLKYEVDSIFLDIKIREGEAFELLKTMRRQLKKMPAIVISTGHSHYEYAQKMLNDHKQYVIKYLEKPFWHQWQEIEDEIIDGIYEYLSQRDIGEGANNKLAIRTENNTYILTHDEITYLGSDPAVKSSGKVFIHLTHAEPIYTFKSLREYESILPTQFVRISKYYIVNLKHITKYDHIHQLLYLQDPDNPLIVGAAYKDNFLRFLDTFC